ncbi:substrate-binding domain-containing protein [Natronoflexus pectinivorans]|uniref:ABC-type molybdate transport system substrate-binding protein n=1 Tax=Natronoflexus pectinivorans TaxID=682526 RepID=A0A4R2GJB2_9BACT|nr:substrate-binding domain-containing protein [Natronoflexus pectinivorans]TCO08403.1 ABC-type molybdate transport system substrate-binding protein [Natronoflexus pectinivorans]
MPNGEPDADKGIPELVIFVENGMVPAMVDLVEIFESQYQTRVRIQNGDAFTLAGMVNRWEEGDLFIPDSHRGLQILHEKKSDAILDSLFLGYNQLAFYVSKGNPSDFEGTLQCLSNNRHMVILANPETSSLGYVTRQLLMNHNLFQNVSGNILALAIDNRRLTSAVVNGDASVTIDWVSSYYRNSTKMYTDTIHINGTTPGHEIYAAVLSTTNNAPLAYAFLALLSSEKGLGVLGQYGINKQRRINIADGAMFQ